MTKTDIKKKGKREMKREEFSREKPIKKSFHKKRRKAPSKSVARDSFDERRLLLELNGKEAPAGGAKKGVEGKDNDTAKKKPDAKKGPVRGKMSKKKTKIITPEQQEEIRTKDFFDCILPSTVKFHTDYYIVGDSFRSVWAIKEYPPTTEEQAILSQLGDRNGVTLRILS